MRRWTLWMICVAFFVNCAGNITHFYNRDGWSFNQTEKLFRDVLVLNDESMIVKKVEPRIPRNRRIKGEAEVKVRIDQDGKVEAVMIKNGIPGLNRELISAAKYSKYKKYHTPKGRTKDYVLIVAYQF